MRKVVGLEISLDKVGGVRSRGRWMPDLAGQGRQRAWPADRQAHALGDAPLSPPDGQFRCRPIASIAFRVTVGDPSRFPTCNVAGAHLGLTPKVDRSGETAWSGRISKAGEYLVRHLLSAGASALMTHGRKHFRLGTWGVAVLRRRRAKQARVAVARKLAVIMHRKWVSGTVFASLVAA